MDVRNLVNQIIADPEGGTAKVNEPDAQLPPTGYFVGGAGPVLIFPSMFALDRHLLGAFVERAPSAYIGWWEDSESGKVYVDYVNWSDSLDVASREAARRGELAFWDIENSAEIRV